MTEPGVQGPPGVQGSPGVQGPLGPQMSPEQADAMLATVQHLLMKDYVFRKPWWKFWVRS